MNKSSLKKRLFILLFVLFLIATLVYVVSRPPKHSVNFIVTENIPGYTIKIYKTKLTTQEASVESITSEGKFVQQISSPTSLQLTESKYLATIEGDGLKSTTAEFEVKGPMDVKIVLEPTKERLTEILNQEINDISSELSKQQPLITQLGYSVIESELFLDGTWCGALIAKNTSLTGQDEGYSDLFRVILHKEKGVWTVKNEYPELIISAVKYPEMPRDVISQVNRMKRE